MKSSESMQLAALFVLPGLLLACTSRTLPLPPPTVDSLVAPSPQGLLVVRGTAHEDAAVGIYNENTRAGVIVTSPEVDCDRTCPFEAVLEAEPGHHLRIWQFHETSSSVELNVPD